MSRKGQSITLSVPEQDKTRLEQLAIKFGYIWGKKANISKLVTAIARHHLRIVVNDDWSHQRIEAMEQARKLLVDQGKIAEAEAIAQLLIERNELTIPCRSELEKFLEKPKPLWREQVENFIERKQPFRLTYQDVMERPCTFTVVYGELRLLEKHQYLLCTCQETDGNQDVIELQHNWTFRLDRIQEAVINPVSAQWQPHLDYITVEFKVLQGLAFGYAKGEPKPDDLTMSEIEGDPPQRIIQRQIFSSFWFFRDIAKYFQDCEILAPDSVRDRFKQKLGKMCQHYDI